MKNKVVLTQVYLYEEDKKYLNEKEKVRGDFSREIRNAVHKRVEEMKGEENGSTNSKRT